MASAPASMSHADGRLAEQVLVLSVPSFATSKTAVLVNLRTLEARPIEFSCDAFT